ncbi:unannotated protein [freshwater metagenome]|uniref:Unannotated protein n=1 Tax=freshwater metagenome TaxID=449393 RepID=A0A6J6IUL5_9ZZZZ
MVVVCAFPPLVALIGSLSVRPSLSTLVLGTTAGEIPSIAR